MKTPPKHSRNKENEVFFLPPELQQKLNREGLRQLNSLDRLVRHGEGPNAIFCEVKFTSEELERLFFGYLIRHGIESATEVLTQYLECLMDYVYTGPGANRRSNLSRASKRELKELIELTDFAVGEREWESGVNPFDGILHIYRFLEEIGYPADVPRRERAIAQLRREVEKIPCSPVQMNTEMPH